MTLYSNFLEQGRRNVLFNGNFQSWPEGVGPITSGDTALMMTFGYNGGGAFDVTASTTSKPNNNSPYVCKITTNTAKTSYTSTDYVHTFFKVEGYDILPFLGNKATLSFWVRSSVPGIYGVFFRNGSNDSSYVQEFTINAADTWEYKTISLTIDDSIGTWDYGNGLGLSVGFAPALGTTHATSTLGQWITGNYIGTTNQVNFAATAGNTFQISQMQLELGDTATQFEELPFAIFQDTANRYYQSITMYINATSVATGTGNCYASWDFNTTMRTNPTITHIGPQFWQGSIGWGAATGVVQSANTYRCLTTMTRAGASYVIGYGMLMIQSAYMDARL